MLYRSGKDPREVGRDPYSRGQGSGSPKPPRSNPQQGRRPTPTGTPTLQCRIQPQPAATTAQRQTPPCMPKSQPGSSTLSARQQPVVPPSASNGNNIQMHGAVMGSSYGPKDTKLTSNVVHVKDSISPLPSSREHSRSPLHAMGAASEPRVNELSKEVPRQGSGSIAASDSTSSVNSRRERRRFRKRDPETANAPPQRDRSGRVAERRDKSAQRKSVLNTIGDGTGEFHWKVYSLCEKVLLV